MNYLVLGQKISVWLREYLQLSELHCFVVGVSGGIDSAVVSTLAAQSGMPTILLNLPIHSKKKHSQLADTHCRSLARHFANVTHVEQDFTAAYEAFMQIAEPCGAVHYTSAANTKSRLRMMALYYVAGKNGGLVVGTGNKIEDFGVGFFTKYGDGGVDISPIADLDKTQVSALGQALNIAAEIMAAAPTDGLWQDDRSDEQQLGASYQELEWAMVADQNNLAPSNARERTVLDIYRHLHHKNRHKMQAVPVFYLKELMTTTNFSQSNDGS